MTVTNTTVQVSFEWEGVASKLIRESEDLPEFVDQAAYEDLSRSTCEEKYGSRIMPRMVRVFLFKQNR